MTDFLSSLSSLLQTLLILLVLAVGFYLARRWHIRRLRALVRGKVPLRDEIKQAVARLFSSDVLEVATLGAITYVDLAWQYSLTEPELWSHIENVETMTGIGLDAGDHAALDHVTERLQHLEALQSFDHSLDTVMQLGADPPDAVLLLDGQPHSLLDLLLHKVQSTDSLVEAKAQAASDGVADALTEAKAGALLEAKADALVDAKASALLEAKTDALVDAKSGALIDNLWDGADLWHHVPLITIGFATYRAWRRAEAGTTWSRNVEFAATEVVARSGGALVGAKIGGTVGTLVVPGYGTVVGGVVGAVGGAIAGAKLSEEIKRRHLRQAQRELDRALNDLGAPYLQDPVGYRRLTTLFAEQEKVAEHNVQATRRKYAAHARWWRRLWPDQKLILLQETVREADERLLDVRQQVRDTLERVQALRQQDNYRALGLILWNSPGMCRELGCAKPLVQAVDRANTHLRHEMQQVGVSPA